MINIDQLSNQIILTNILADSQSSDIVLVDGNILN
jgi:hypothetical protein